ncbi:unnamed protein product [Cladocopium goreaui]|uniref:Uncharacterized protein n=1 Tax=Cladocopium goreaui TaxID=2562237 RepID=A0A9P1BY45_9DINO|nr:unnamed protein product [Cladocopium goreaui]
MSASADSLDNVSISSFDEEVQEQRAERVRQLYREDRERKAEARAAAAAAKKEQAAEKKAAKAAAKAKAAAQGKDAKGKKTAQERRAAPPVWRRTKAAAGGAKAVCKREEHREEGSTVDARSYWDLNGPLDSVQGLQQELDFNTPLERPVDPDEWSEKNRPILSNRQHRRTAVEAERSGACSPAPPQFLWSLSKEASQEVLGVIAGATWLEGIWRYARAWLVGKVFLLCYLQQGATCELAITAEELAELRRIAAERPLPRKETKRSGDLFPEKHGEKFGASKFLKFPKLGLTCPFLTTMYCQWWKQAHAGAQYTTLEIGIPGGTFQFTDQVHNAARLKVVDNTMTEPQARDGQCQAGQPLVAEASEVENTWGQPFGSATTVVGSGPQGQLSSADTLRADDALVFRIGRGPPMRNAMSCANATPKVLIRPKAPVKELMGGNYRVCYSANGTFGLLQADITRQRLEVNGVFDRSPSCTTTDCLSRRLYQCYMRREEFNTADGKYGLQSSCVVDYSYAGAGFFGPPGRGSWTAEFVTTYDETGTVTNVQEQPCAQSEPAAFICRDGGACEAGDPYITPDATVSSKRINIPTTRNDLFGMAFGSTTTYNARTVAACYCPDRNGCTNTVDFIQQIGILHFYLSKVCHAGNAACTEDFTGVTGQYRFRIRVECPSDACMLNDQNRVKLVEKTLSNDLPSWDSGNGCRTGLHGNINGLEVLPTTQYVPIDGSPTGVLNELNCDQGSPVGCRLSGGTRQDYKTFGGTYGFRFILGSSDHEARGFHTSKEVDVCYCNGDCNVRRPMDQVRESPTGRKMSRPYPAGQCCDIQIGAAGAVERGIREPTRDHWASSALCRWRCPRFTGEQPLEVGSRQGEANWRRWLCSFWLQQPVFPGPFKRSRCLNKLLGQTADTDTSRFAEGCLQHQLFCQHNYSDRGGHVGCVLLRRHGGQYVSGAIELEVGDTSHSEGSADQSALDLLHERGLSLQLRGLWAHLRRYHSHHFVRWQVHGQQLQSQHSCLCVHCSQGEVPGALQRGDLDQRHRGGRSQHQGALTEA